VGQKPEASFIWSIANLLRGPYKPNECGDVVLPMTILRRLGTDEQRPARGQAAQALRGRVLRHLPVHAVNSSEPRCPHPALDGCSTRRLGKSLKTDTENG